MTRTTILLSAAALALGLAACGGDEDAPVEGTTTPTVVQTTETTGTTATTADTGGPVGVAEQLPRLKECLGGEEVTRVDVFEPTYELAKANGGAGFAMLLRQHQVQFIVYPDAEAAAAGQQDAQNRLISIQQTDPAKYGEVSATAMQVIGNVLEIAPKGATPQKVSDKIFRCVSESSA